MKHRYLTILAAAIAVAAAAADPVPGPVRFEAESCLTDFRVLGKRLTEGKWELWKSDPNAKNWSGGKVLRGMPIRTDRSPEAPESALLRFRVPVPSEGRFDIVLHGGRTVGISTGGRQFRRVASGEVLASGISGIDGFFEFQAANCFAENDPKRCGSPYIDYFTVVPVPPPAPRVRGFAERRVKEPLGRGAAALPLSGGGVYVNWRLLESDPPDLGFDVFRIRGGQEEKLTAAPVVDTCDFTDPAGTDSDRYAVRPAGGAEAPAGESAVWESDEEGRPFLRFKLYDPKDQAMRVGIGDLDGDGVYDYVVKTPNANIDPYFRYWTRSTGTYRLEAFRSDGTPLWRRDLGWAIERGVWYSPFIVGDFNGDGRAEVAVKLGEGDPRGEDGKVTSGSEYLVALDGLTGRDIARAPWPARADFESYNLASRNQLSMAYLDGKTPAILALRGTYGRMKVEAWQLHNGRLEPLWKFDNGKLPRKYRGQGAHATVCADLDSDGRDEILLGSMALDDNGEVLWSTGKGHPDYAYLGDIIPSRPGLEIGYTLEIPQRRGGICVVDAKSGESIWELPEPTRHTHYGYCVDFDPAVPGMEMAGIDRDGGDLSPRRWRYSGDGKLLESGIPVGAMRRGIYWDADLEKELCINKVADFGGGPVGGGFGGRWIASVDLCGDWREEAVVTLPGEMRIYAATIPAMDRRVTLMQDPVYRSAVLGNAQGYYSEPALSRLPGAESVNFSLIARLNGQENTLKVTVSAPRSEQLRGEVVLSPPEGLRLEPSGWSVELAPGEAVVQTVRLSGTVSDGSFVCGTLRTGDRTRQGRVQLIMPVVRKLAPGTLTFPAAAIASETGGKTRVISGRPGAPDGCLSYWDDAGHTVSWSLEVPAAGRYELQLLRASGGSAERRLTVNGRDCGTFLLSPTGGNGQEAEQWEFYTFRRGGSPVLLELTAGKNLVTLENTDGTLQNLAYLYLKPVR